MKNLIFTLLFLCWTIVLKAQTTLELNIQHKFKKSSFVLGQPYMDAQDRVIEISRVQYYISAIELMHDGGQITALANKYILVDGNQSNYNLGTVNTSLEALENVRFDLGINAMTNLTNPLDYAIEHPLSELAMYSTSQSSYIFLAIEGLVDTDGDNIADEPFVFRVTDSQLLQTILVETKVNVSNDILQVNLTADIAKWLEDIDLKDVGIEENGGFINTKVADNTNDFTVFSNTSTTAVQTLVSPLNHIYVDTRLNFAPTIYYKFYTGEQIDMTITNIAGSYFIQQFEMNSTGDFYMEANLPAGLYIVMFSSPKGIRQCKKFTIIK